MSQQHTRRPSPSPLIETVWQSIAQSDGTYLVTPDGSWDLISARAADGTRVIFLAGQVTKATRLSYKAGGESVVISFTPGAYMPHLKGAPMTDSFVMLNIVDDGHFELLGHILPLPTFDNAEAVVQRMTELGLLALDPIVSSITDGQPKAASKRSVQRHFKQTTGITHKKLQDIRRAQDAVRQLKKGESPASTAAHAGYYDQPHLTKSLKKLMDSSPTDVDDVNQV